MRLIAKDEAMVLQYVGLFASAVAFEYAYVAWARAANAGRVLHTVAYSVGTAALSLAGVGGALRLPWGTLPYLGGIALGAFISSSIPADRKAVTGP